MNIGSPNDWTVAFQGMTLSVLASVVVGGVVGFLCRGHIRREIVVSALVVSALFACFQLIAGSISFRWPLADIINGTIWLAVPFILLFLLPAVMASVAVGQWGRKNQ